MDKEAFQKGQNLNTSSIPKLAISGSIEHECDDAQPCLDPDSIKRFCQVWGEVGRAILARRSCVTA